MAEIQIAIPIPYEEIAAFCKRHHIRKLSLFGSVLRDDFNDGSDIDVLVVFEEGHTPGWEYYLWGRELAEFFQREVDLLTAEELSPHFRDNVLQKAFTVYERK